MRVPVARVARGVRLAALAGALLVSALAGPGIAAAVADPCADPSQCATFTVSMTGNGWTQVRTADGYVNCTRQGGYTTGTCSHKYVTGASLEIGIVVNVADGSTACDGNGQNCLGGGGPGAFPLVLTGGVNQTLTYIVSLTDPSTVTVKKYGTGKGSVVSTPIGVNCGTKCTGDFSVGSQLTLQAKPLLGVVFSGWTAGPCTGSKNATCTFVVPSGGVTVKATFTYVPPASPSPSVAPTAAPTDTPAPTVAPTDTPAPTAAPTEAPTAAPTAAPTTGPAASPVPSPSGDTTGSGGGLLVVAAVAVIVVGGGLFAASRRKPAA